MVQSRSSQVRVIPKDLAAEPGGQGGQPFRVSQKLLLALANDRLEGSLQSGRRHHVQSCQPDAGQKPFSD
jgi:hypothetical protein